jgi:hypothetical protein
MYRASKGESLSSIGCPLFDLYNTKIRCILHIGTSSTETPCSPRVSDNEVPELADPHGRSSSVTVIIVRSESCCDHIDQVIRILVPCWLLNSHSTTSMESFIGC